MTYRPGTVKRDMTISLPRPRDPSNPAFNAIREDLGLLMMQEEQRFSDDERKGMARD